MRSKLLRFMTGASGIAVVGLLVHFGFERLATESGNSESPASVGIAQSVEPPASSGRPPEFLSVAPLVTYEDVEAAIQAVLDCGEDGGLVPRPVPGEGLRRTQIGFFVPDSDGIPDEETVAQANELIDACRTTYLSEIEEAWLSQQAEPSPDDIQALTSFLSECMASPAQLVTGTPTGNTVLFGAYAVDPEATFTIEEQEFETYAACSLAAHSQFGLLAPPPEVTGHG